MDTNITLTFLSLIILISLAGIFFLLIKLKSKQIKQNVYKKIDQLFEYNKQYENILHDELERSRREFRDQSQGLRIEVVGTMTNLATTQRQALENMDIKINKLDETIYTQFEAFRDQALAQATQLHQKINQNLNEMANRTTSYLTTNLENFKQAQHQQLEQMRYELEKIATIVEERLREIQNSNEFRLEQIRQIVDEKLHNTLEARLGESFSQVRDNLDKVNKSLGEMMAITKGLNTGVLDLQRVLTGVKTKGIWGEVQLETLLEQVLPPDMYLKNVEIKPGSNQRVEFAVRLPGQNQGEILLPLDAKFPYEQYARLVQAADLADSNGVEAASRAIEVFVRTAAKEISDKYITPPHSTNFAIMFLPTEGIYSEVLRRPGLIEILQRDYRVIPAGPTTLYAVLNSFQMGFCTLAIQRKTGEIWQILSEIKTEFIKFGESIDSVRKKLHEADKHLDKVAVRSRVIDRKLKGIENHQPETKSYDLSD